MGDAGHGLVQEGGAGYTMTWLGSGRWGRVYHDMVQKGGAGYTMTWFCSGRWGRVHHDMTWFRKVGQGIP